MMVTQLNPDWLDTTAHVAFLNDAFAGHWDRASYDFFVARSFQGRATDIAVRTDGRRLLAGASFCYRQLELGDGALIDVCIMSAGATLRSERGRGHYRELLDIGRELCRTRGCAALLGFVTRGNASGRGLTRLGAYAIASYYLASPHRGRGGRPASARALPRRRVREVSTESLVPRRSASQSSAIRIHYPELAAWRQQFVHRAHRVRALRLAHDSAALVETVGDTDRLQWLGCPARRLAASIATLAAASAAANRRFFMYTLDPSTARTASRLGLAVHPGWVMVLPIDASKADWGRVAAAGWDLQSGDRM